MIRLVTFLMTAFSLTALVHAQGSETLSWDACVQIASTNNPELGAAQSKVSAAENQERAAYNGFFPQISGALNYSHGTSSNTGFGTSSSPSATDSYSATLTGTQNLFSGLQDKAKVDQAKANLEIARADFATAKAQLGFDLKSAFAKMIYAQDALKLTEDFIKRRTANLRIVGLRFESGSENKGSYLLSKAYLEQARLDHLQAQNALGVARADLARVLGREESESILILGAIPTATPASDIDFHQLVLQVPSYRQAIAKERVSEAGVTLARAPFFPTLNLTGTTGDTGNDWYPDNHKWSVGASLTFPLFNGGRDYYGIQGASDSLRAAAHTRVSTLNQTVTQLKQAYNSFVEAVQKLEVDRSFALATAAREKIGKEKYNNGLLSFENWDIIENDLIVRQKSVLQSERDRVITEAAWDQTQGKGVIP